ncbi:MAG: TIGR00159 family protein [Deltaproteobacteria bacterium]|nr:TIGR00159 family protein [Deltaproteobacteria bacterium]
MTDIINLLSNIFRDFRWQDAIDFFIMFYLIYRILLLIKGTRAVQMLTGIGFIIIAALVSKKLELSVLNWVLDKFIIHIVLVFIILFQDDIRRALTHVGRNPFFSGLSSVEETQVIDEIVKACVSLSQKKIGALIVLERQMGLTNYIEVGHKIDSQVNSELIISIFLPYSPIHDGALILQKGRITAAGCFLPLTVDPTIKKTLGTRHRAALGLTEETDAVVLVVSEEEAEISLVVGGKMRQGLDAATLRKLLINLFKIKNLNAEEEEGVLT